jgi:adenylate cyclase class IV
MRLLEAGARPGFAGVMIDVRYDRNGELALREQVLRLRLFRSASGERAVIGWKGPASISTGGLKTRRELEYEIRSASAAPEAFPEALGYQPVQTIERYVEYYHLGTAEARLEWYPRMDTLIEIEGDAEGIEAVIRATGIPRAAFTPEPLSVFAGRYATRTGAEPAMTLAELGPERPRWPPQ